MRAYLSGATGWCQDDDVTNSALDDFMNADWKGDILPRLTNFAVRLTKHYSWSTPGGLPKGLHVEDIVVGAIQKTLEGLKGTGAGKGTRIWNQSTCPSLLTFLMGVVRSDISALAKSKDHQVTDREREGLTIDKRPDAGSPSGLGDRYEELMTKLRPIVESDHEVQQLVLATEELINAGEEANSKTIMELTGFGYSQFRNVHRRLQTAVASMKIKSEGGS